MNFDRLRDTDGVRYCLDAMQKDTIESKVIRFLYEINLIEGKPRRGVHREANRKAILHGVYQIDQGIEFSEFNSRELKDVLGMEWSVVSTVCTKLQRMGIARRRADGRSRYVSLTWETIRQIHEALATGRILPIADIETV